MVTERELLEAVREFLGGRLKELDLRQVAHRALADHVDNPESQAGRLAIEIASLCTERYDGVRSEQSLRVELESLLPTRSFELRSEVFARPRA